jgi:hypothetical protein
MDNEQTSSAAAPAPFAITATVAIGATALAALTLFDSSTVSSTVAVALMLSTLWGGLLLDWFTRSRRAPKQRKRSIERPSFPPRLSTPGSAFAP